MSEVPLWVLAAAVAFVLYTYLGYPLILRIAALFHPAQKRPEPPADWPNISITLPAHNEEETIQSTIESLLRIDYPSDKRQILIVSDASTDRTDEIVSSYSGRGVELFRVKSRAGKTAAENAARGKLTGDIIVNTDASVRIHPQAVKALVTMFQDPNVGVASGRDVSVDPADPSANIGEKGYVGYEMWVRSLETRVLSIVQASGCLYAARRVIQDNYLPESLTRDYGSVAAARKLGFRAVSVDDAVCFVPRTRSLRKEYRRKVRTMTRGIGSLLHNADLLSPIRHGAFAWMVLSHKLCRWLAPVAMALAALALLVLAPREPWALGLVAGGGLVVALGALGWAWPDHRDAPRLLAVPAYVLVANIAAINGWVNVMRGNTRPVWSPTRREPVEVHE